MSGFLGVVWPVRDGAGRPLVLKIHSGYWGADGEGLALDVARGPALVELVQYEPAANALLLERLDHERRLAGLADVDAACGVIGDLVAQISSHHAPPGMRLMADELERIRGTILEKLETAADALPRPLVDRALDTLAGLSAELRSASGPLPLVHGDCHYENVLHTLSVEPPRWVAIDPLPMAGYPELEVVAALRGRWADAAATDNPE